MSKLNNLKDQANNPDDPRIKLFDQLFPEGVPNKEQPEPQPSVNQASADVSAAALEENIVPDNEIDETELERKTYYLTSLQVEMLEVYSYSQGMDKSEVVRKMFDEFKGFTDNIKEEAALRLKNKTKRRKRR